MVSFDSLECILAFDIVIKINGIYRNGHNGIWCAWEWYVYSMVNVSFSIGWLNYGWI